MAKKKTSKKKKASTSRTSTPRVPNGLHVDHLEANRLAFEQLKMAWDDEVDFAETLVGKRQHTLTATAFIVGASMVFVGVMASTSTPTPSWWTLGFLIGAGGLMLISLNYTLSSSPFYGPAIRAVWKEIKYIRVYRVRRAGVQVIKIRRSIGKRASRDLFGIELLDVETWLIVDKPADVITSRTYYLHTAYIKLRSKNDKIKKRIKGGTAWFFHSLTLGLFAFAAYLITISNYSEGIMHDHGTIGRQTEHDAGIFSDNLIDSPDCRECHKATQQPGD